MRDDHNYSPPEDIFAPDNSERVVWGYPLDLADWESWIAGHFPWRLTGETQTAYVARIAPFYPDHTTPEIARWYERAAEFPA